MAALKRTNLPKWIMFIQNISQNEDLDPSWKMRSDLLYPGDASKEKRLVPSKVPIVFKHNNKTVQVCGQSRRLQLGSEQKARSQEKEILFSDSSSNTSRYYSSHRFSQSAMHKPGNCMHAAYRYDLGKLISIKIILGKRLCILNFQLKYYFGQISKDHVL